MSRSYSNAFSGLQTKDSGQPSIKRRNCFKATSVQEVLDQVNKEDVKKDEIKLAFESIRSLLGRKETTSEMMAKHLKDLIGSFHLIVLTWDSSASLINLILEIRWPTICFVDDDSIAVVEQLTKLLCEFVTIDVSCLERVIKQVVCPLYMGRDDPEATERTDVEMKVFEKLHELCQEIITTYPREEHTLCRLILSAFPYHVNNRPHGFVCFMNNFLCTINYVNCKEKVVMATLDKLLWLDLSNNKSRAVQVFRIDGLDEGPSTSSGQDDSVLIKTLLDKSMLELYNWIDGYVKSQDKQSINQERCMQLYKLLYQAFVKIVMPTDGCSHVQYAMFYLCSFSEILADEFIDNLWSLIRNEKTPQAIRLKAINYCASFLTRSQVADVECVMGYIELAVEWIDSYDCVQSRTLPGDFVCDLEKHAVYYRLFQSVIYLIVMRKHELDDDSYKSLRLLNFQKLISSTLNPLGVCSDSLLTPFASISRHYQLALCSATIQRNKRTASEDNNNVDESFLELPYDGIVWTSSFQKLRDHYRDGLKVLNDDSQRKRQRRDESFFSDFACSVSPKDSSHMLKMFLSSDCSGTEDEIMTMDFSL